MDHSLIDSNVLKTKKRNTPEIALFKKQTKVEQQVQLQDHPLRSTLYNELHSRPFPILKTPSQITQLVLHRADHTKAQDVEHLTKLSEHFGVNPPHPHGSTYYQDFGGFELRWEGHTEFSTYSFFYTGKVWPPFSQQAIAMVPSQWLQDIPGHIISSTHISLTSYLKEKLNKRDVKSFFEGQRLIGQEHTNEKCTVWTSFRTHSDSHGRFLIINHGLNPCESGRMVQRILELESYRMMALLSFPNTKDLVPKLAQMDLDLAAIIDKIRNITDLADEKNLLHLITKMAAQIEHYRSTSQFRFGATRAYASIVNRILSEFQEKEISGIQTIKEFLLRRFDPAIKTCESVQERIEDLSRRIDRAGDLLRTQISITLESQNQKLLISMNKKTKQQLLLQQTVEGLSTLAICYYVLGLLKIVFEPMIELWWPFKTQLLWAFLVPLLLLAIWALLHRIKLKIMGTQ